jgi:hypothetical protein
MSVNFSARRSIARRNQELIAQSKQLIRRTRHSIDDSVERIAARVERTGDDSPLVRLDAARIAAAQGAGAVAWILRREDEAVGLGDRLSAEAWADLAAAAEGFATKR